MRLAALQDAPPPERPPAEVPAEALRRFHADPAFDYGETAAQEPSWWDTLLGRALEAVFEALGRLLRAMPEGTGTVLLALMLAVAIGVIVARLLGMRADRRAAPPPSDLDGALAALGIEGVALEPRLDEALAADRHREVVRLRFLLALQALARAERIAWAPDRTNRAYRLALRGTAAEAPFATFATLFDAVWYGDLPAGPAEAEAAADHLDALRLVASESVSR